MFQLAGLSCGWLSLIEDVLVRAAERQRRVVEADALHAGELPAVDAGVLSTRPFYMVMQGSGPARRACL